VRGLAEVLRVAASIVSERRRAVAIRVVPEEQEGVEVGALRRARDCGIVLRLVRAADRPRT
jgi:hypothetical protein